MVEIPNMKFLQLENTVLGLMVLNDTMTIWYYTITNLQLPNMYDHVWYDCIWVHVLLPSEVHSLSLFWFLSFFYRHLCFVRVFLLPLTGETNWKAIWLRPGNAQWIGQGCDEGGAAGGSKRGGLQHAYPCGAFVVGTHSTRRQLAIFLDLPPLRIPDSRWPIPIRFPFPSWGLEPPSPFLTSYKTPLQSKPSKQKPTTARFFLFSLCFLSLFLPLAAIKWKFLWWWTTKRGRWVMVKGGGTIGKRRRRSRRAKQKLQKCHIRRGVGNRPLGAGMRLVWGRVKCIGI